MDKYGWKQFLRGKYFNENFLPGKGFARQKDPATLGAGTAICVLTALSMLFVIPSQYG
ncbi:hypothetical protein ACO0LO_21555 [Undibacterium sp. TJN25]|uniref:hypothetical protein n=1 Tax=Undibacterium sp. TJN25 TaxID=3413056 RepID=UPI003BF324E9